MNYQAAEVRLSLALKVVSAMAAIAIAALLLLASLPIWASDHLLPTLTLGALAVTGLALVVAAVTGVVSVRGLP